MAGEDRYEHMSSILLPGNRERRNMRIIGQWVSVCRMLTG